MPPRRSTVRRRRRRRRCAAECRARPERARLSNALVRLPCLCLPVAVQACAGHAQARARARAPYARGLLRPQVYLGEQYVNNPTLSDVTFLVEVPPPAAHVAVCRKRCAVYAAASAGVHAQTWKRASPWSDGQCPAGRVVGFGDDPDRTL